MASSTLRILIVEDSDDDLLLITKVLRPSFPDAEIHRVQTSDEMACALRDSTWDVVLSDFSLPRFNGVEALQLVKKHNLDLPFIIVSGSITDDMAVAAMKAGAHDFVMKDKLARLIPAITREIKEAEVRRERQRAERELRQSEERQALVLRTLPMAFYAAKWSEKMGLLISWASPSVRQLSGFPAETFMEQRWFWNSRIHPDDLPAALVPPDKPGPGAPPHSREYRWQCANGEYRWFLDFATIASESEFEASEVRGIWWDITERKRTEELLRQSEMTLRVLVNGNPESVFLLDAHGTVLAMNETGARRLGKTVEQIMGAYVFDLIPPEVAKERTRLVAHVLRTGEAVRFEDVRLGRIMENHLTPIIGDDGKVVQVAVLGIDITERKQAESAVEASELRYRQLLASVTDYVFTIQFEEGRPVSTVHSRGCEAVTGYTPEEYGQSPLLWLDMVHPEDRDAVKDYARSAMRGETCEPLEHRIVHKDGTTRWVRNTMAPNRDMAEHIVACDGLISDITERKNAELAMVASEQRFRLSVETLLDGFAILSAVRDSSGRLTDLRCEYINEAGCRLNRLSRGQQLGHTVLELFKDLAGSSTFAEFTQVVETGLPIERESTGLTESWGGGAAEPRFFDYKAVKLGDGLALVWREVTERVRAEQERVRLAAAVERAGESFIITDADGGIIYVNPAFENTTGYSAEEVLGRTPRILKSAKHDEQDYAKFWDTIVQGKTWSGRFTNKQKDGTLYEVAATVTPMIGATGEIVGYVGVERDITREILLETQFRQTQKMEAIATLAGGIAHDFNNILSAVMGYTEMARQDLPINSPARNALDQVHCAGVRATDLVRQILTFSREREKEYTPLKVDLVVKEALKLLQATIPSSVGIEVSVAPDCAMILSDPSQIHQIVMNLCTNAYQAMPNGGQLEVRLENMCVDGPSAKAAQDLGEGQYVRLTVSDTGHGMDDATLERVFEPFFTTKSDGGGTGLGLATVHSIVKNHGGTITVYSEPGRGTTFHAYFPALGADAVSAELSTEAEDIPKGNGEHVLMVDDEESLMILGRNMLQRLGYRVTACNRAVEALSTFAAQPDAIDLIVTDQTMPILTGLALIQELRKLRPDIPAILCTGFSKVTTPEAAASAGISEILRKPISLASLAQAVHKALAQHRASSGA